MKLLFVRTILFALLAGPLLSLHARAEENADIVPLPPDGTEEPKPAAAAKTPLAPNTDKKTKEPTPLPADPVAPPPNPKPKVSESGDPPAETVPLPAEKPQSKIETPLDQKIKIIEPPDDAIPTLSVETPVIAAGESAVFSLYGPETFLRGAIAHIALFDEFGRETARSYVKVANLPYSEGKPRQLKFEIKNPLGQFHHLKMALTGIDGKQTELSGKFSIAQHAAEWKGWLTLAATPPADGNWSALQSIGVRGGLQYRLHPARREALRKGNVPFYVENIARQLLSRYHTEPGLWNKAISGMIDEPNSRAALSRDPSLCAPAFAEAFAKELRRHAEVYAKDPPLFYSLASEPSVTNLSAAADFDFSAAGISEFQRWLERDAYGTLAALNQSWGTQFKAWTDVIPMTTDEARLRMKDGVLNFAPWADFREFQDHAFSKVLRDGGDYIRRYHPSAKVGITGALGPFAYGGWDWSRLSQALDVVECYDIGGARQIWRDLAPGKPALAVIPLQSKDAGATEIALKGSAAEAARTAWDLALEGGPRAALLWDDSGDERAPRTLLDSQGQPTAIAKSIAPVLKTLEGDAGILLSHSERAHDGVAVLYSPASVRLHWLFEAHQLHGDKWLTAWGADSAAERRESTQLKLRESWSKLLDDMGLSWRYVSSAQIEKKLLQKGESHIKTLVLPQAMALSDREVYAIKQFVADGGRIVADAMCGRFDEHGKLRDKPALDELFQIDTSSEPFSAQPMNPLERVSFKEGSAPGIKTENMNHLPPVFSDRPKWLKQPNPNAVEYRRSPVLATSNAGVYLNLNLANYLRWRLHPDQPRAQAVRDLIGSLAFQDRLDQSLIDWKLSALPAGTQVVWLQTRGASGTGRILALKRNPQSRLHELGNEGDGNWAFEKPEPFKLVFKDVSHVIAMGNEQAALKNPTKSLEGTLDPVLPSLFIVNPAAPKAPRISLPQTLRAGAALELNVKSEIAQPCVYHVRWTGPDGQAREHYSAIRHTPDGSLTFTLPTALNDTPGAWSAVVRDLAQGSEAKATFTLQPAD